MKDKKKLTYIVSEINKSLHFEWILPLLRDKYELNFILIGLPGSELEKALIHQQVPVVSIDYKGKRDLLSAWIKVFKTLFYHKPDIIHTHLWIANLFGLTTGWLLRTKKRIYTRHHATIHYDLYPSGLKWDKLNNAMATDIIAVSKNIEWILLNYDKAKQKKVVVIPHGFNIPYFQSVSEVRTEMIYKKYELKHTHPIIGVISRFIKLKGVQFVIPAFEKLLQNFPDAHLVLANAHGDYEKEINKLLSVLPSSSYTTIKFENDLAALYTIFDIFVHVPFHSRAEAFGQTYVEPLLVGIPSIFTLSGIAPEFIQPEKNAIVVDFENPNQIYQGMNKILTDERLRSILISNGLQSSAQFSIEKYIERLEKLYNS